MSFAPTVAIVSMVTVGGVFAASQAWQKEEPAQWTSEDVYQILNNSPWAKPVTLMVAREAGYGQNGGVHQPWDEGMPGGGMGRMPGGMGGGGMGRQRGGYPSSTQEGTIVTVEWASALPVRLAEAKLAGGAADPGAMKPLNQYVIAVIGFPKSGFVGHQGSMGGGGGGGSDEPIDDQQLADHLKVITTLSCGGERLNPARVELNQGRDGRAIFYFDKPESRGAHEKDAEFRIAGDRMDLRKKFALKDMEYQGKLEL
ncbi:MAG: hypothetical protein JO051_15250 [Acidobacteriaceae bacterium]|nr:hypothetical protein [Acidobacteriaceae bacterium]